ncbi:MAG: YlbF family regulator [Bacilli bacterium]|nr:YlbF family regulator [Bacilli bacterium]
MNKLDNLLEELSKTEVIKRFKELEKFIDQDKKMHEDYQLLLALQKQMVQDETKHSNNLILSKKAYELQREKLSKNLIIEEYLDLLDEINQDIQTIQEIINNEIKSDFE